MIYTPPYGSACAPYEAAGAVPPQLEHLPPIARSRAWPCTGGHPTSQMPSVQPSPHRPWPAWQHYPPGSCQLSPSSAPTDGAGSRTERSAQPCLRVRVPATPAFPGTLLAVHCTDGLHMPPVTVARRGLVSAGDAGIARTSIGLPAAGGFAEGVGDASKAVTSTCIDAAGFRIATGVPTLCHRPRRGTVEAAEAGAARGQPSPVDRKGPCSSRHAPGPCAGRPGAIIHGIVHCLRGCILIGDSGRSLPTFDRTRPTHRSY